MLTFQGVTYDDFGPYNAAINAHAAHVQTTTGQQYTQVRNPDGSLNEQQTAAANQGASSGTPVASGGQAPFMDATNNTPLQAGKYYRNPTHGHIYLWDGRRFLPVANDPQAIAAAAPLVTGTVSGGWGGEWHGPREVGLGEVQQHLQQRQAPAVPAPSGPPSMANVPPAWQQAANAGNAQAQQAINNYLMGQGSAATFQQPPPGTSGPVTVNPGTGNVTYPATGTVTSPPNATGQATTLAGGTTINQGAFAGMGEEQFRKYLMAQLGMGTVPEGMTLPGLAAKLGPILGGLPSGVGFNFHQLLFQDAWKAAENALAFADRSGYLDNKPTLERQQIEAKIANDAMLAEIQRDLADDAILQNRLDDSFRWAELTEQTRQFNVGQSGMLDGQLTLAGREQAAREAEIRGNPRMSAAASFLPDNRGSLGGMAPGNALPAPMSFGTPFPTTAPAPSTGAQWVQGAPRQAPEGTMFAQDMVTIPNGQTVSRQQAYEQGWAQQPQRPQQTGHTFLPLGTPGADDHTGTIEGPNGLKLHLYATPRGDANIPIAAATSALFSGKEFSATGALPTAGGYASQSGIANTLDPKKIAGRQWDQLDQDEKDRTLSVLGAGGRSEANVMHSIEAGRPRAATTARRGHVFI